MDDYDGDDDDDEGEEGVIVAPPRDGLDASSYLQTDEVKVEPVNGTAGEDAFLDMCPICEDTSVKATKQHLMAHLMPELVEAFQGLTSCPEPDCETLDYYQVLLQ